MKRILITQNQFKNLSGSEIVTLELAQHFSNLGLEVVIFTHYAAEPSLKEAQKINNCTVVISEDLLPSSVSKFDLVWVHHQLIPVKYIEEIVDFSKKQAEKTKIVFNHMSGYLEIEFPIFHSLERAIADHVLYNSKETRSEIEKRGVDFGKLSRVFPNPAPDDFFVEATDVNQKKPKLIAIISNHPPTEVLELPKHLEKQNIKVEYIGRSSKGQQIRINPDLLLKFDVVVSIGKTVQYCLMSGTPVYCYDHFAGPGYLNESNFRKAADYNFSGRGFVSKKTSEVIAKELVEGYSDSKAEILKLKNKYAQKYLLSENIEPILNTSNRHSEKMTKRDLESFVSYTKYRHRTTGKFFENMFALQDLKGAYIKLKQDRNRLKSRLEDQTIKSIELENNLRQIRDTKAYRVAKKISSEIKKIERAKSEE